MSSIPSTSGRGILHWVAHSLERYGMPVYTYHGLDSIERAIQQELTKPPKEGGVATHFVMEDVPSEIIKYLLTPDNVQLPSNTDISAYDISAHRIIIKMPELPPHSTAVAEFCDAINMAIRNAGFRDAVVKEGAALHRGSVRGKQPDSSWKLLPPNYVETRERWPRIVLEVGLSESKKKLKEDARFWLDNSDGTVKLMLTLDISEDSVTLEAWERKDGDVVVVKKMEAEIREGTWRMASENNALQFPVEDVFGLPPIQGHSEVILLRGDDLVRAAANAAWQKEM
ncbi:Chitin synthase, class 7 [Ascosphaera pollenicola]|nr:Chitin synthase, class 7 [Ascosphaera pollenicola]